MTTRILAREPLKTKRDMTSSSWIYQVESQTKKKMWVEMASNESHSPFDNLITSYLTANDLGLEVSPRIEADVVLCLVFARKLRSIEKSILKQSKVSYRDLSERK